MEMKLVRWKIYGQMIENGIATSRAPGDEDEVEPVLAGKMEVCGQVNILGSAKKILAQRSIPEKVVEEIIENELRTRKKKRTKKARSWGRKTREDQDESAIAFLDG